MAVYKRGEIWWYDFTDSTGERRRGSTRQRRKDAALQVEARERRRAELGEIHRPVPSLKEAADKWFAARMDGRKSAKTKAYRMDIMLRHLDGALPVNQIDTPDVEDAMQARRMDLTHNKRPPTNGTVNRDILETVRPILTYCREVLKVRGMADIEWRKLHLPEPKGRTRTFTPDEIARWRAGFRPHHQALFDFICRYGVRLGEVFFPLNGYEPETGRVTVRERKNGLPHSFLLLPDDTRDMNARYRRAGGAGFDTVWFWETRRGIKPIRAGGFQSASARALKAAGIVDARRVHDLRHHAATAFLRLPGASLKGAQRLLGHEDIASTARYAHVSEEDVLSAMRHTIGTNDETAEKSPESAVG